MNVAKRIDNSNINDNGDVSTTKQSSSLVYTRNNYNNCSNSNSKSNNKHDKVIDTKIKEIDQSTQKVNKTTGQDENEPSLVHTKNRFSLTPPLIESITTMKLSSLASINGDRGPDTSENKRKNSPHTVKPNTVKQPSNTSNPFHSPFHLLPSSDANDILEQMIHAPTDNHQHNRRQPHPSRTHPSSPSHSRPPVPSPHHHPIHIHPPNDSKEIRNNSKLRFRHYNPHSSPFIQPNIAQSESILDNDDDESAKKKENRRYLDSLNITPAPDPKQIFERSRTTQNIKYSQPRR